MSKMQKVATLRRRADYLRDRLDHGRNGAAWDAAELAALEWALPILDDLAARNVEVARDVHRQRAEGELVEWAVRAYRGLMAPPSREQERVVADCPDRIVRLHENRAIRAAEQP
jgi:hypothetical protein